MLCVYLEVFCASWVVGWDLVFWGVCLFLVCWVLLLDGEFVVGGWVGFWGGVSCVFRGLVLLGLVFWVCFLWFELGVFCWLLFVWLDIGGFVCFEVCFLGIWWVYLFWCLVGFVCLFWLCLF